jgi:hypothetical protein
MTPSASFVPRKSVATPFDPKRVIQISAIPESTQHSIVLFALTDDGSIFSNVFNFMLESPTWDGWRVVPPIAPPSPVLGGRR